MATDLAELGNNSEIPRVAAPAVPIPSNVSAAAAPGKELVVDADAEIVERKSTLEARTIGRRKVEPPICGM
jgi:hypothetical protein